MIMPSKHIDLSESFVGLGAFIIILLKDNTSLTVDDCWKRLCEEYINKGKIKRKHSFDNYIITIDMLYSFGAIKFDEKGELFLCAYSN